MSPEEVPDALVEKAARAIAEQWDAAAVMKIQGTPESFAVSFARHALAAVLPEIQAQALRDEADRSHTYHFSDGDRVEYVHGERSRSLMQHEAARLTTATEEPTT